VLKRHLEPGGSILVQAIVIGDTFSRAYRRHPDFIQTYVFPRRHAAVTDQPARAVPIGRPEESPSSTVRPWIMPARWRPGLAASTGVADQVTRLGFDERFRRMWRYILRIAAAAILDPSYGRIAGPLRHIITVSNHRR